MMTRKISIAIAFLTGLGMIFIGAKFLLAPETAKAGYGIHFNELGDYSFHYIKGIRDVFSGLVICILVLTKQTKALGITLAVGIIIPVTDMLIVLSKDCNGIAQAIPYISAIIVCAIAGTILLISKTQTKLYENARLHPAGSFSCHQSGKCYRVQYHPGRKDALALPHPFLRDL